MAGNRQRQFYKEFILLYKSFPCLWDTTLKAYYDRAAKQQAYVLLVQKYKEIDKKATRESVTRKINDLRTGYRREKAKITKSLQSGAKEKSVYKPTLWYFDLFSFLDESRCQEEELPFNDCNTGAAVQHSTMEEVVEKVKIEYIEDETCLDSMNQAGSSSPVIEPLPGKRKYSSIEHGSDTPVCNGSAGNNALFCEKQEDASDIFGKHIAYKLRSLSRQQYILAQKLINDVLFEAEMEKLNRNCRIVDPNDRQFSVAKKES